MQVRRYLISGRVQGVGFRYFVQSAARRLDIDGWVRNLPDGRVECAAGGSDEQLDKLETELRRGPPLSKVDSVNGSALEQKLTRGFQITH